MRPERVASPVTAASLVEALGGARRVAVSLEDSSMRAYRPRVCVLALVLEGDDGLRGGALVDLVALEGVPAAIAALRDGLRAAPQVVMHAGEHAVAALRRDLHLTLPGLSDTASAATLLGLPQTGYRSLCAALLGQTLAAAPSIDWRLRPLSEAAEAAAWQGAALLLDLHDALAPRVAAAGLEEAWAIASAEVAATRARSNLTGPESPWRVPEARGLGPAREALFAALIAWREDLARERDCPPGQLIPNRELALLARTPHESAARLADENRFHSRLMWPDRESLRQVLVGGGAVEGLSAAAPRAVGPGPVDPEDEEAGFDAVADPHDGDSPPDVSAPRLPALRSGGALRPTPVMQARLKRLKAWRAEEAARRGVGLQAVLPTAVMAHLARHGAPALAEGGPATRLYGERSVAAGLGQDRLSRYGAALARLLEPSSPR